MEKNIKISFYPYDFAYKVRNGKTYMYLYGKKEDGSKITVIHRYDPYFYCRLSDKIDIAAFEQQALSVTIDAKPEPARVLGCQKTEKCLLGKKLPFWKITVNFPKAVPLISRELESAGIGCYEKDILFTHRYLRDHGIIPMTEVKAQGKWVKNEKMSVPVFLAESIQQQSLNSPPYWKVLALDIETYAKKKEINPQRNPILMAALYGIDETGKEFKKVITWREFSHDLSYLIVVKDEAALLKSMKEEIKKYCPDIITGYFSDVFDLPYIKTRAEKLNVALDFGADFSEIKVQEKAGFREGECSIAGMLHLDILKFIKYIFGKNLKTDSYSLDSVSEELLGHKKHIVNLDRLAEVWDNEPQQLPQFCEYNLHDARLTFKLCQLLLPDIVEFSKIIGLPPFDVIRMRFSRLVENYILKRAIENNVLAPNKPGDFELSQRIRESVEGAFVYEPKPGLYHDLVVFDFRSLYPTIITAHNISPEGLRCSCCRGRTNVPGKEEYWFCTNEKKFIPSVLEELVLRRAELKKQIKEAQKKKEDTKLLESRSYAFKLLANSFYGYLGFYGARWYCLECAASTTAYARNYIRSTIAKASELGFSVVYADTDSCFLLLGRKTLQDAKKFMDDINISLPGHMELELVGYFPRGIFVALKSGEKGAKKKYALLSERGDIKIAGFETVRRNWSLLSKEVQEKVLRLVLEDNVIGALQYVRRTIHELRKGNIPLKKLIIKTQLTQELSRYASIGPHVMVAQKLKEKGEILVPGTVIQYVIVKGHGLVRDRARLPEEVSEGQYDVEYYVNHQLIPAVSSIFTVLGYSKDEIFGESSQKGLGMFLK